MSLLILVRHGTTDWNQEGRWHGLTDIPLNQDGRKQARQAAEAIKDLKIDKAYTSNLSRTKQTYDEICDELSLSCPVIHHPALNERDYGIYTGKNKWEVQKMLGDQKFNQLRRNFDYPVPEGETLKDVYGRVVPYYKEQILADLRNGLNVMVVSSGNTLRALIKYLETLSDDEIAQLEVNFGEVNIYSFNSHGQITNKERRATELFQGKH